MIAVAVAAGSTEVQPSPDLSTPTAVAQRIADALDSVCRTCLYTAVVATPLFFRRSNSDAFARPKSFLAVACVVVAALVLVGRCLVQPIDVQKLRQTRTMRWGSIALVASYAIGFLTSVDRRHAVWGEPFQLQGLVPLVAVVAAGVVASLTDRDRGDVVRLLGWMTCGSVLSGAYAIAQVIGFDPWWDVLPSGRAFSTLGQANALGAHLVITTLAALTVSRLASNPCWRWAALGAACLSGAGVCASQSRGAYLALAMCAPALLIATSQRRTPPTEPVGPSSPQTRQRLLLPATGVIAALMLMAIPSVRSAAGPTLHRIGSISHLNDDPSAESHVALNQVSVAMIADNAWTGVGPDEYVIAFAGYRDRVLSPEQQWLIGGFRPESPHNALLAKALDGGLPALGAYIGLVAAALIGMWRASRRSLLADRHLLLGCAAIVVGHFITDLFMTGEISGSLTAWVVLGAAMTLTRSVEPADLTPVNTTDSGR
jgi:O-antigen ligase